MSKSSRGQLLLGLSGETDLLKLQRQHRRVVGAKQTYMKQTRGLIIRDKLEIQWLHEKNEELLSSLRASQGSRQQTDLLQDLTAKMAHGDRLDEELEAEKRKVASLKDQIAEWEKKLTEQRSCGAINHNWKFKHRSLLKTTTLIENKLDKEHKYVNELMSKNEALREEVKTLQAERKKFLKVKSLLEKELHTAQKSISHLMTKCTQTFDASVKIWEKQKILTDQNAKNMAQYDRERINLERKFLHYCNTAAFLNIKDAEHISQNMDHKTVEKKLKKNETNEWELKDFNDAITKVIAQTEEYNLDNLVSDFIQTEEQNYVLLTFINRQDKEAETIRKQISQLQSEMDVLAAEEQRQRKRIQAQSQNISNEQEAADQQLASYKQQDEIIKKLLDQLREGLKSLLQICYRSSELGSLDNIQNENITQYLGMIEDRVNELFTLHSYLHFYKNLNPWDAGTLSTIAASILGINPQMFKTSTAAVKPVVCHDSDLVESELLDENEPMSKEVLLSLIKKKIRWKKKTN